jgi:hypothetical protein
MLGREQEETIAALLTHKNLEEAAKAGLTSTGVSIII